MSEFDYESAWEQMAKPEFEALSQRVKDLVREAGVLASNLAQDKETLDLPWPEGDEGRAFKAEMERLDSLTLAKAARAVHDYGHWSPGAGSLSMHSGAYWRFSNYADQILSERCGMRRNDKLPARSHSLLKVALKVGRVDFAVAIHEGIVRLQFSSREEWLWEEVGWATEQSLEIVRTLAEKDLDGPTLVSLPVAQCRTAFDGWLDHVKTALSSPPSLHRVLSLPWTDVSRFMVPSGTLASRSEARRYAKVDSSFDEDMLTQGVALIYRSASKSKRNLDHAIDMMLIYTGTSPELRNRVKSAAKVRE